MDRRRRQLVQTGLLGSGFAAAGIPLTALGDAVTSSSKPLDILVLGGTGFIGPHMVREALRRGHKVTLFNRGRTNEGVFPDLETVLGDRGDDLSGLAGRSWDAVIDNSGYVPRHVENSARLLAPRIDRYLFISTVAVYADFDRMNDVDAPLARLEDESIEEVNGETYGALKALCEKRAAAAVEADRLTIVRPTYICGPGDHTDRFTWYPVRTRRGGDMLWPGSPAATMQIVDVRDLAAFVVDCIDNGTSGTFNAVNPPGSYTFGELLADCQDLTETRVDPVWVDDAFIDAHDLGDALPIYRSGEGEGSGFVGRSAYAAGLRIRPERETVRDLLHWWDTLTPERHAAARFALTAAREAELVELARRR
ncbi:MAG TPA: NAD-dependent epimerase/dehydratase family protein [Woeseiaceae bacterium]|nr:NAD-dependent epimerase/dehydratase family protein [Woeseiaceae bacterium]